MGAKKYIVYGAIAAVSAAEGAYEAITNTPGFLRPILTIIASGIAGGYTKDKEVVKRGAKSWEECFFIVNAAEGFVKGTGLSAICEGAGYGATKGVMALANVFS